jgi:hypothetical protein
MKKIKEDNYVKYCNAMKIFLFIGFIFLFFDCASVDNNYPQVETIQILNSYQTNLTARDIATFFINTANRYLSQANYYHCGYTVMYESDKQDYAWACEILRATYRWGIVYSIILHTNNGEFIISTSNQNFTVKNENSKEIITFRRNTVGWGNIVQDLQQNIFAFFDESIIASGMNNKIIREEVSEALDRLDFIKY